ncbi:ATP-binding protein [Erwinia aphidicola]|uniref:ATP-binding protein n=3 Tax=Erwinia TaxID=551 RepID=A0ABU8DEW4_ERWAP
MQVNKPLELRYSHNIIEHLGLKLYQNRPTNVLAELVSNAWDADADKVWIDIDANSVAVYDNGTGMSRDTLVDHYLIIGKRKRTAENIDETSPKGRKYMGRKGIGKLAPFGIAKKISVFTIEEKTKKCCWFEVDLSELLSHPDDTEVVEFKYNPKIIYDDVPLAEIETVSGTIVDKFVSL